MKRKELEEDIIDKKMKVMTGFRIACKKPFM
jgi:hypothetical protein